MVAMISNRVTKTEITKRAAVAMINDKVTKTQITERALQTCSADVQLRCDGDVMDGECVASDLDFGNSTYGDRKPRFSGGADLPQSGRVCSCAVASAVPDCSSSGSAFPSTVFHGMLECPCSLHENNVDGHHSHWSIIAKVLF